jgi:hypothetical protein
MPSVIAWFSPNDTLLVDQAAVIFIIEYSELAVTLEVLTALNIQPVMVSVGTEWARIYGALEVRYLGIFVNEKCEPARQAGIEIRKNDDIDVRRHSFAGVPIRGARPLWALRSD